LHCPYRRILGAKDNVRGGLGHRRRGFSKLIHPKTEATGNDLQIVPLNEAQPLEFVKKRCDPWYLTGRARCHAESIDASGLLRSRDTHQTQRCRRISDKGHEFPPPHGFLPAQRITPSMLNYTMFLNEPGGARHSMFGAPRQLGVIRAISGALGFFRFTPDSYRLPRMRHWYITSRHFALDGYSSRGSGALETGKTIAVWTLTSAFGVLRAAPPVHP
jgi:hypothetical protein